MTPGGRPSAVATVLQEIIWSIWWRTWEIKPRLITRRPRLAAPNRAQPRPTAPNLNFKKFRRHSARTKLSIISLRRPDRPHGCTDARRTYAPKTPPEENYWVPASRSPAFPDTFKIRVHSSYLAPQRGFKTWGLYLEAGLGGEA